MRIPKSQSHRGASRRATDRVLGTHARGQRIPFRMMWFTPLIGVAMVVMLSIAAAALSVRPVLIKLQPGVVFAGR